MRARLLGHQLHPMLVVFPLGLLITSVVWDIVYLATENATWAVLAFWTIVAGLVGGFLAAIPGFIDWLGIPTGTRAKRVGLWHLVLNLLVVGLFGLSLALRAMNGYVDPAVGEMLLGWLGIALGGVSGWLGGEMVERLGVGVWEDANLNAPSSLRAREPVARELGPGEPHPV